MKKKKLVLLLFVIFSLVNIPTFMSIGGENSDIFNASPLGILLRPSFANPVIISAGDSFEINIKAPSFINLTEIKLVSFFMSYSLQISEYRRETDITIYTVTTLSDFLPQIYDIELQFFQETSRQPNAVMIISNYDSDKEIEFIQITDLHTDGSIERTKQINQLITEVNLINPDFVLLTGDVVQGLTSVDNKPVSGDKQFPIAYNCLRDLTMPVLICNGNHDYTINNYMNGIELWEEFFLPVEYILRLEFRDVLFVGASTYDVNGLTSTQISESIELFNQAEDDFHIFFAHSDYDGQFPDLYLLGDVDVSFLGHEHSSLVHTVGSTLEIITDNSVPYPTSSVDPGHFRLCTVNKTTLNSNLEYQSLLLNSSHTTVFTGDSDCLINGRITNQHEATNFSELNEEIIVTGQWELISTSNLSNIIINRNTTHSRLKFQIPMVLPGNTTYTVQLEKMVTSSTSSPTSSYQITSNIEKTTPGMLFYYFIFPMLIMCLRRKKSLIFSHER
jgi:predicted MPP superfamily phosphohydrolase